MKPIKGVEVPYIKCLIRGKEIKLTPEEAVRQLYIYKLIHEYGYPTDRIQPPNPPLPFVGVKFSDPIIQ